MPAFFFFSSRRRHTRSLRDWSSDVCSSDLVGDTAVDPAHRGVGLGKWLKAAITRQILTGLPGVRWVITYNAGSNDAMLAINNQLGFRTAAVHTTWQVETSKLRDRLSSGGEG